MDIRTVTLAQLSDAERTALLQRSAVPDPKMRASALDIVDEVRKGGDAALVAANERYGGGTADAAIRVGESVLK